MPIGAPVKCPYSHFVLFFFFCIAKLFRFCYVVKRGSCPLWQNRSSHCNILRKKKALLEINIFYSCSHRHMFGAGFFTKRVHTFYGKYCYKKNVWFWNSGFHMEQQIYMLRIFRIEWYITKKVYNFILQFVLQAKITALQIACIKVHSEKWYKKQAWPLFRWTIWAIIMMLHYGCTKQRA